MSPIDRNPRQFYLAVIDIDVRLNTESTRDFVTIKLSGHVTPTIKERLSKALLAGEFEITERRLV
jgi:hypothetical protein